MEHIKNPGSEEFKGREYLGIIEDVDDPLREGKARIRVYGVFDNLATEDLPWASPAGSSVYFGKGGGGGSMSIPKKNSVVKVTFDNGDIYTPQYYGIQEIASDLTDEFKKGDINTNYHGSHFVLFDGDEELRIWFTREKGITMQLKDSRVNIAQDSSITIEHKDTQSIIELKGGTITINSDSQINMTSGTQIKASSNQVWMDGKFTRIGHSPVNGPAVLGDKLFLLLQVMAAAIDSKMPSTPGFVANFVETFKAVALSNTVIVGK